MILYYVRHGDPIYNPNQLTELGQLQAAAVGKRVAVHGIDKIYTSPSNRARQTAQPLCNIVKQTAEILTWADEDLAYPELRLPLPDGRDAWVFRHPEGRKMLNSEEIRRLGRLWYTHPWFQNTKCGEGIQRLQRETDGFLETLGYRHDLEHNCYTAVEENDRRIALFAHEGVGAAILSCMLDIPYPVFSTRFDMTHSGMTVIEFKAQDGVVIPRILTYSNDSHLYREGLPTRHQNRIYY